MNVRKLFFSALQATEPWYRLSREVVGSQSLKIFRSCLDTVLGNLFYGILLEKGELDLMTSRVPFQHQPCSDSVRDKN